MAKIIVEFCDICEAEKTNCKCEICGRFICYGKVNCCLKSCGIYFNKKIIYGLKLCPKCNNNIEKKFLFKNGTKQDEEFRRKIENQTKEYFKNRFKANIK